MEMIDNYKKPGNSSPLVLAFGIIFDNGWRGLSGSDCRKARVWKYAVSFKDSLIFPQWVLVFRFQGRDYIFTGDIGNDAFRRTSQQLSNHHKLINMVLPRKYWRSKNHFRKYTARTPNIDLFIIPPPSKHNFGSTVVPRRDVSSHLSLLHTSKAKVANFQIAIFVDENVAGFEVAMNYAR